MEIVNTQRAITPRVEKPELQFLCCARRLNVFNVCVKFHETMSLLLHCCFTSTVNI